MTDETGIAERDAPRLSVTINTCDEAHLLPACVASVRGLADEILVCDMESADGSAALARELGCRVISHPRRPTVEPEARTAAVEAARGEWILVLDPDMRLPAATAERLRRLMEEGEADIVDFCCENYYFGRRCPHGHGSQPVYRKMFRKRCFAPVFRHIETFWRESLHGRVRTLGREHALVHLSYPTVAKCVETLERYARRQADADFGRGRPFSLRRLLWAPVKRFGGNYVLRQGFRDGLPGLIVSVLVSWYLFTGEAYLWDRWRRQAAGDAAPEETAGA